MLKLLGVSKNFGARTVLNEVSFDLNQGEYVAVVGESGIGKSTLLHVIAGLDTVDSGRILFEDADVARLDDAEASRLRREKFGFVFQAFHVLPHLTVEENVALPLLLRGISSRQKAKSLIAAVGLSGREASPPRELSGGELQRVAVARALVNKPDWLFLDEATAALPDPGLYAVLRERLPHTTLISVGHQDNLAPFHATQITWPAGRSQS